MHRCSASWDTDVLLFLQLYRGRALQHFFLDLIAKQASGDGKSVTQVKRFCSFIRIDDFQQEGGEATLLDMGQRGIDQLVGISISLIRWICG
jgi:hypothetical protein